MISTSSTTHVAIRSQGVCRGTLWRQESLNTTTTSNIGSTTNTTSTTTTTTSSNNSSSSNNNNEVTTTFLTPPPVVWSPAEAEYCSVTLNWLFCHESLASYERGDAPVRLYQIVGASSFDVDNNHQLYNYHQRGQHGFRLVTNRGTQLFCQAVTAKCRDQWLASLNAGLELALLSSQFNNKYYAYSLPPPQPSANNNNNKKRIQQVRYCCSCGASEHPTTKPIKAASPLIQYGFEDRCDLCRECFIAQGLLDHLEFLNACLATSQQEHEALLEARKFCYQIINKDRSNIMNNNQSNIILLNQTTDVQPPANESTAPPGGDDRNSDSSNESWTAVDPVDPTASYEQRTVTMSSDVTNSIASSSSWIHITPTSKSTLALLRALRNDRHRVGPWMRLCPFFQTLSEDFLEGRIGVVDFFEQLDEAVGQVQETVSLAALKKQAFRMAGDMGTAMKLLLDHALPKHNASEPATLQTLSSLLEFFLDLCQDGALSSVAFFWPQLCHLHLCMLPPTDALAIARVDLFEDFLLTVATRYSIHLALDLVWSHSADLEESLGHPNHASPFCRARRFAVLRFVCELESLLFGHEDGWGGGSVALGKMLSATADQLLLLKRTFMQIQDYRNAALYQLAPHHSVRHELYQRRLNKNKFIPEDLSDTSHEVLVQEKLRIAKNADYFTTHLNFIKRVCDIAEKLRFMDLRMRDQALREELILLNSSGAMGGDPLNRIRDPKDRQTGNNKMTEPDYIRIVRIPINEGHVFRSKERTPVLLLVELVDEGAEPEPEPEFRRLKFCGRQDSLEEVEEAEQGNPGEGQEDYLQSDSDEDENSEAEDGAAKGMDDTENSRKSYRSKKSVATDASGGLEGASHDHRSSVSALKRFDVVGSPSATSVTPKTLVDEIITHVMVEQCNLTEVSGLVRGNLEDLTEDGDEEVERLSMIDARTTVSQQLVTPTKKPAVPKDMGIIEVPTITMTSASSSPKALIGPRRMLKNPGDSGEHLNELAPTGDIRREVLNVIMMRGRKERYSIAAGTAYSVQRSLKELETRRATALLLGDSENDETQNVADQSVETDFEKLTSTTEKLASLGLAKGFELDYDLPDKPSEEDEVMEAVRLLLIQNRVDQGQLSAADAARVLQHVSLGRVNTRIIFDKKGSPFLPSDMPSIDAGDLDRRLAGCGPLPPAVLQALTLWKGEMVTNEELLELVKKDIEFVRHSVLLESESVDKLKEDSAFWGRFAFGERWAEKKARISACSPQGSHPGWDLVGIIVKSNDDLRQEAFVMQLIELCQEAFEIAGLELWVSPYRILATGRTTGIIETVRNAMSFDALKKRPGYGKGGLREHLHRMTEHTADPGNSFKTAQQNFVRSLAAYSLISYFFMIKDRHNGNLLLDTAGHVIHIDFGFVFGVAPGGSFSLEMSTPFKLTEEMLEVMGGLNSPLFSDFITLFCCGFLALQSYSDTFFTLVEITSRTSTFKCFDGQNRDDVLSKLRERFCPNLDKEKTIAFALDLIKQATTSYGTRQYDLFQYLTQGVAA